MTTDYINFPVRICCHSKIRRAFACALLSLGERLFLGVRFDIEIKDGRRWVPIIKAERLFDGAQ